ncbi:MAG: radical SAM protein [Bacteroidetes bacterium]|nr:radical SAM protein [Bacteroidota bacterium]
MSILINFLKTDRRCKQKFIINLGWKGFLGFKKFKKRKERGEVFPAFQFISVTNDCNLKCQGCWVTQGEQKESLDVEKIHSIINESKKHGSYFFGILGGEPLIYKPLLEIFKKHPDCYFQLFTNGTLFTDQFAEELRKCANVTPLFSFEGDETVADVRRGGNHVFKRASQSIEAAVNHKLITGVAISVCKSNIEMALSEAFIQSLHDKGVIYLWYYIYRPSGENPCYDLALSADEIIRLRKFMVEGRTKYPLVIIDSYWRADGEPFCPAAEGLSHHINPSGNIEPCPVVQFACDSIDTDNLTNVYENSVFIKDFKSEILQKTKGCVLMEDPAWLQQFAEKHEALNTSNRKGMPEQLRNSPTVCSHGSCPKIPEKQWIYRMAKKMAFFGLGAYG